MHYLIISDLHLGGGDAREDFLLWGADPHGPTPEERPRAMQALDDLFQRFLKAQMDTALEADLQPHLILLGDIVDLWQARRPREPWSGALVRVLQAHPGFVVAVRQWIAAGGLVTWVIGNHDQPLVDPEAWALVREIFSTVNAHMDGAPIHSFSDPTSGLHAEHGHRWDPFNRIVKLDKADADCLGFRIVRHLVNPLEELFPLIDKGADVAELFALLWEVALEAGRPALNKIAPSLRRWLGRSSRPACALLRELEAGLAGTRRPDFGGVVEEQTRAVDLGLRGALEARRGALTGNPPQPFHFLAHGHTHQPTVQHYRTRRHGARTVLNPGTWRPVVRLEERDGQRRLTVEQRPGGIVLSPAPGWWEARQVSALELQGGFDQPLRVEKNGVD